MPPVTATAAWGRYNNINRTDAQIRNEERAYGHHYLLFTDQLHLMSAAWGDSSNQGANTLLNNLNAQYVLQPDRIARGTVLSMGINVVYVPSGGVKHALPSAGFNSTFDAVANGVYDQGIDEWGAALVAYKALGAYEVHALFDLEPDAQNQPEPKGSGPEYVAAYNRVRQRWTNAGVLAAGIKLGIDLTAAAWRLNNGATAAAYSPPVYDVCSADFYPQNSYTTKLLGSTTDGLGRFFTDAATNHPNNPVQVRSVTISYTTTPPTDLEAATWFTDANNTLQTIPNLLGVGWDCNNTQLDVLTGTESDGNYTGQVLTKQAFHDMAIPWTENRAEVTPPPPDMIDLAGYMALT